MTTTLFGTPTSVVFSALFGLLFGFLLNKARVTRFNVIVGQLLLKDFTVMKVIFTAIIVGGIGVYAMLERGLIAHLLLSNTTLAAAAIGGSVFGVGMAVLGYCPGTCIAACGDGSAHAKWGLLGMLVATASFAELYPYLTQSIALTTSSPQTLPQVTGLSVTHLFLILAGFAFVFFSFLKRCARAKTT